MMMSSMRTLALSAELVTSTDAPAAAEADERLTVAVKQRKTNSMLKMMMKMMKGEQMVV